MFAFLNVHSIKKRKKGEITTQTKSNTDNYLPVCLFDFFLYGCVSVQALYDIMILSITLRIVKYEF